MKTPTVREQIRAVQIQIDTLVRSYTDLAGSKKGQIRSTKIRREVARLRAAIHRLGGQKTFNAAIRQLRARIVRVHKEHGACEREIKRLGKKKWRLFYESKRLWKIVDAAEPASQRK